MANDDHYGNADDFVTYCETMGYTTEELNSPTSPSDEIDAALRRASLYIDGRYRVRFSGKRALGRSQTREWPRIDAIDTDCNDIPSDEVPIEVVNATYEAAFRELENPGSLTPDFVATEQVQSERVGPLSVTYKSSSTTMASDTYPVVGTIDAILAPLIGGDETKTMFGQVTRI